MLAIRPATRDEAAAIIEFQLRMARETEGLELDPEVVAAGVQAVFDDASKGCYWVALESTLCVASLLVTPEWSDWRNGTVLWIQSVYVRPDYRRRGVLRAMYRRLAEQVEGSPELRGLRLYVDQGNVAAQAAYRELGMDDEHYLLFEWLTG